MFMPLDRLQLKIYAFSGKFNVCSKRVLLSWIKICRDFMLQTQIFTQKYRSWLRFYSKFLMKKLAAEGSEWSLHLIWISVEQPQLRYIAYRIYCLFFKILKNIATAFFCDILWHFFGVILAFFLGLGVKYAPRQEIEWQTKWNIWHFLAGITCFSNL